MHMLDCTRSAEQCSNVVRPVCTPTSSSWELQFLHVLALALATMNFFQFSKSGGYLVVALIHISQMANDVQYIFISYWPVFKFFIFFLLKCGSFSYWFVGFFSFCILDIISLSRCVLQISSPCHWLSFSLSVNQV